MVALFYSRTCPNKYLRYYLHVVVMVPGLGFDFQGGEYWDQ